MFRLMDRLLMFGYVKAYIICLVSLLGLYIIVDLFNNIDDFAQISGGLPAMLRHIAAYYGCQLTFIFDRLSEAIVLLAAVFTVAWLQRNNELLPLLSGGVSTQRVVRPVLVGACLFVGLNVVNQEFLIPRIGDIAIKRDDPEQAKNQPVTGAYDSNKILLSGTMGVRKTLSIEEFHCTIPADVGNGQQILVNAKKAIYVPPGNKPDRTGGWLLMDTNQSELRGWTQKGILERIAPGEYFLYTDVDFDAMTRPDSYYQYLSTYDLFGELERAHSNRLAVLAVFFHMRLTRPLLGLILVFMGLGIILSNQNRHVFISMGSCLVLCAFFFGTIIGARYLGNHEWLTPAMAAWLPVFLFGPIAFVLFDAVHT